MSRSTTPAFVHKLYAIGLIVIVVFVLIAWVVTAFSVQAKTISNLSDHDIHTPPEQCVSCHQTNVNAPKILHVQLPTCGYCHR